MVSIIPHFINFNSCFNTFVDNNNFNASKMTHNCDGYTGKVLNNLNNLRLEGRLCDVEIVAEEKSFKAHKAILASSSPYFHAMFTSDLSEKCQNTVELHRISPSILAILIDFIYSGQVTVTRNNVQELIIAADMLEFHDVVTVCSEFLINELHPSNAIGIYKFADDHNCKKVANSAFEYLESNFSAVSSEKEFYQLPIRHMTRLLASERIRVESEYDVFNIAIRWIMTNISDRRQHVFEILEQVRLPLLSPGTFEKCIADCSDSSLKVALKSVQDDVLNERGCLVPLTVTPRLFFKKDIYVVGGLRSGQLLEPGKMPVERFDIFRGVWSEAPDMSMNRIAPGAASLDGKMYVVGGELGSAILASGEYFDPGENAWSTISNMTMPRSDFGLCVLNGYLYAMGGWVGLINGITYEGGNSVIGGTIERYDPKEDEWSFFGNLPKPRFSMGVVSYGGLIYLVGGSTITDRYLPDLMSFNPNTKEWRNLSPMSSGRSGMGVAVICDHLYVVGGDNGTEVLSSVEKYSFKKNKWFKVSNMTTARNRPAVVAVNSLLYAIGGVITCENFYIMQSTLASVECLDTTDNVWSPCPNLPDSRAEAGAAVL